MENCLLTAKQAGSPRDQVEQFLNHLYIPLPWQWQFHATARLADQDNGPVDIGTGGARGPGKSHAVLSQVGLDDCQRIPGLKGLFLRQTGLAAKESFDDLVDKVLRGRIPYEKSGNVLRFANDSRIVLGGFQDASDIDKYIGIEYDFIIVEELNQLTEDKYTKLRGSLRTSKPGWRPRMYTSFNPGGIGHAFVRDRYILPNREGTEKETRFIGSTYKSNPYLNKEYIDYLESLAGDLGKAWREGEWELFAGQVFNEFRHDKHTIDPITPKDEFRTFLSFDWGYNAPFACYVHSLIDLKTIDGVPFKRLITWGEWYGTERHPAEWARIIYQDMKDRKISGAFCDPAMMNRKSDGTRAIASDFEDTWNDLNGSYWLSMDKASNDRVQGWALMHRWLSNAPDGMPFWLITKNCRNLIRTLPMMVYDDHKVDDIDSELEDHACDSVRYALMSISYAPHYVGGTYLENERKNIATVVNVKGQDISGELDQIVEAFSEVEPERYNIGGG